MKKVIESVLIIIGILTTLGVKSASNNKKYQEKNLINEEFYIEKDEKINIISNNAIIQKNEEEPIDNFITKENITNPVNIEKNEIQSKKSTEVEILTLNTIANEVSQNFSNVKRIEYGTSVQGRPLEAYLITGNGANTKTIFMEFEVHGYEDEYAKDGKILVDLANELVKYYAENSNYLIDYQMIVVPSANPDGVIDGKNNLRVGNNNAFGRCTADGIDINRDFKECSFKAIESQKLKELMDKYPMTIHLDFHGWEDSCIGDPIIVEAFLSEVELTTDKSNRYGSGQGYVIEYTKDTYGANSAIVEFKNSRSIQSEKVEKAISKIIEKI